MRNREQESKELDKIACNSYGSHIGQIFVGRCIKYLADTMYLIHREQNEIRKETNE